ncbi:MAG: 3-deoxy-7-phosphoheptulonate synthase [Myxococcales bacterium]|nr:3-deoxy-7-phosphoheptulonate synthase [Myxococcales bacterium]
MTWSPSSWEARRTAQEVIYPDQDELDAALARLRTLPPLVTSWEIDRLKALLRDAQEGKRFLLQGGDCAETLAGCQPSVIENNLKILLQMSLVMIHGGRKPVIRVGRMAGQYAKPRSKPVEVRDGVSHPSYFGDLVNRLEFDPEARTPDPWRMLEGYTHAAMTLNFVRSLSAAGFADLHHPEYWDLAFLSGADLSDELRAQYRATTHQLAAALEFMEALGEGTVDELTRVEFFTSHEGLNLPFEAAQTREVPHGDGFYDHTTHLPWIGERTRALDGAHVEFFRGIRNAVGVKVGPTATPEEVIAVAKALNPEGEPGKLVLITRLGVDKVEERLPVLVEGTRRAAIPALWVCDPMHGNTRLSAGGVKTRSFGDILQEIERSFEIHAGCGSHLGGVHFELTGEDVTECTGGGLDDADLDRNYASACDPRLNYRQSLEMAFAIARKMGAGR